MGCHSTQETRVQSALDDVANITQVHRPYAAAWRVPAHGSGGFWAHGAPVHHGTAARGLASSSGGADPADSDGSTRRAMEVGPPPLGETRVQRGPARSTPARAPDPHAMGIRPRD